MAQITIIKPETVEVKYLQVRAGVRQDHRSGPLARERFEELMQKGGAA